MVDRERILAQVRDFVTTEMGANDPAHDGAHVERVVALTLEIGKAYSQADLFRAELLAWLHDMTDDKLSSNKGVRPLLDYLQDLGVAEEDREFIIGALPYISYRKHPKLGPEVPLEIRIVQDADRIDAMGAIGIARTFAFGGAKNRPLEESLRHFEEKLLLLYDLLSTHRAKVIALPHFQFLKAFYDRFCLEFYGESEHSTFPSE